MLLCSHAPHIAGSLSRTPPPHSPAAAPHQWDTKGRFTPGTRAA